MEKIVPARVAVAAAVLLAVALSSAVVGGQLTCAAKLIDCGGYLNATAANPPPASCCGPMKDAVTNDLACLCAILQNPGIVSSFNITEDKAFNLARYCGVQNLNGCSALAPNGTPAPPVSPSAAVKTNWVRFSGLMGLFLSWCFIVV